jgi:hypothetical protein
MINLLWRTWLQNFITLSFSSKPQHRWEEGGKELHGMLHMIINDVGRSYKSEPDGTNKLVTLAKHGK